jgi:DNA (cytosine-5)-methyltransferase 1
MLDIEPVWASEIEPYPIKVTTHQFPFMKHLGDITKINGAEIEPVDIITFGSPCQNLSIAGKQAGLIDGEQSSLFFEAIRVIREMRKATNGKYPRFAMWENVPGAFTSRGGEDFLAVLQAFCETADEGCSVSKPQKGGWNGAGAIVGDGFSVAWRTLDSQFWGVPAKRRRVFLVADFRGQTAPEVLFKRDSLRRDFTTCGATWEAAASDSEGSAALHGRAWVVENHPQDSRVILDDGGIVQTLSARMGTGGGKRSADSRPKRGGQQYDVILNSSGDGIVGILDASYYKGAGARNGEEREFIVYARFRHPPVDPARMLPSTGLSR